MRPWTCLAAVLAGFQAPSVSSSISDVLRSDNGCQHPVALPSPSPLSLSPSLAVSLSLSLHRSFSHLLSHSVPLAPQFSHSLHLCLSMWSSPRMQRSLSLSLCPSRSLHLRPLSLALALSLSLSLSLSLGVLCMGLNGSESQSASGLICCHVAYCAVCFSLGCVAKPTVYTIPSIVSSPPPPPALRNRILYLLQQVKRPRHTLRRQDHGPN